MRPEQERTEAIVRSHGCDSAKLIAILQEIQATENYLSQENMTLVADMLGISVARVYSVATFYENFSLEPKGKHIIKVCDGTACHVRKSGPIYDAIREYLGLEGKRICVVIGNEDIEAFLSFRNIPEVNILPVGDINTYELVDNKALVIAEPCLARIEEVLA